MAKLKVTFEVDTIALFDRLQALQGDTKPLGDRLAGALMTGEIGFTDRIAMSVYGINLNNVEKVQ